MALNYPGNYPGIINFNNNDEDRMMMDPNFKKQMETYAGQANPYSYESQNPVERRRAYDWFKKQEEFMRDGRPPALDWKKVPQAVEDGKLKDLYSLDAFKIDNPGAVKFNDLTADMQGKINPVNLDRTALNSLQAYGMNQGASPWLNLKLEEQKRDEMDQVNSATAQIAGAGAQARTGLAMKGGLSTGARERLARSEVLGGSAARQNIANSGAGARLGLNVQDESNKLDILKAMPGMQAQASSFDLTKANALNDITAKEQQVGTDTAFKNNEQNIGVQKYNADQSSAADKFNSQASLNELLQQRAFESNKYNEAMKAWGAEKTAQAQGSGGKK